MVIEAAMESKTEGTMWKSIKNYIRNWCQKWPCILFGAIYRENKQWSSYLQDVKAAAGEEFFKHEYPIQYNKGIIQTNELRHPPFHYMDK